MTEQLNTTTNLGVSPTLTSPGTGSPADGFPGVFTEGKGLQMQSGGGRTELRGARFRGADNCGHSMNWWLRRLGTQEPSSRTTLAIAPLGQALVEQPSFFADTVTTQSFLLPKAPALGGKSCQTEAGSLMYRPQLGTRAKAGSSYQLSAVFALNRQYFSSPW